MPNDDRPGPAHPPAAADSAALPVLGLQAQLGDRPAKRSAVFAWALWDWGLQPFNTVIVTFIFTALYLTTDAFLPPEVHALADGDPAKDQALAGLSSGLGLGTTIAGLLILAVAPVLGQQADAQGKQKLWLGIGTGGTIACMLGLWFAEPAPTFFGLGVALIAAGTVFNEIGSVNSNALLVSIASPHNVGRISGLGWGFGYLGGILALVLVVVFYVSDWFGLPEDGGLPFRLIAVGCALWGLLFTLPVFFAVPEPAPLGKPERRVNFFRSYALLVRDVVGLYRSPATRNTFWFLLASSVFRDGLSGVFTFGAIIAAQVFGFGFIELVIFGIAANLIAGVSTLIAGRWDDRFGPKAVIVTALAAMVVSGLVVFAFADGGAVVFWVFGLALCACVGPAQSAGRSFLARVTPAGREGEIFGLYATTGRAASWMSSLLWTVLIALTGATIFGVLGIVIVLAIGLALLLPVRAAR
ncbi:MFS transporter [Microbacterium sp. ZXX196]|uniref:MFS transporter n=1 Tax=Microbacterium sp. ZXX196 TaxID=2609291 RepID=UPI0012B74487|nr:MFS transporter [Microbacterium sp. ZXX196]MTE23864.1 MFS transporter [Microbacterium sp. ZXX196]